MAVMIIILNQLALMEVAVDFQDILASPEQVLQAEAGKCQIMVLIIIKDLTVIQ